MLIFMQFIVFILFFLRKKYIIANIQTKLKINKQFDFVDKFYLLTSFLYGASSIASTSNSSAIFLLFFSGLSHGMHSNFGYLSFVKC